MPGPAGGRSLVHFQAKRQVLGHRHMGIERVALKHDRDVPIARRQFID